MDNFQEVTIRKLRDLDREIDRLKSGFYYNLNLPGVLTANSINVGTASGAASGAIRTSSHVVLANGAAIETRNNANAADNPMLSSNSSDEVVIYNSGGTNFKVIDQAQASVLFQMTNAGVATIKTSLTIATSKVLGARVTGWTAATNTKTRTTFDTTTVTLAVLAAHVGALMDDLISHGLIGT